MKKNLPLFIFFISFSHLASAQFNKGDILLGGQLSYAQSTSTNSNMLPLARETKTSSGLFSISAGKAVSDHAVLGIMFSYSPYMNNNYYNSSGPLDYSNNTFAAGLFYRIYAPLGKNFFFFGEGGAAYRWNNESGKDDAGTKQITGSGSGGGIVIYPGISYKLSKKVLLELSIPNVFAVQYNSSKTTIYGTPYKNDLFTASTSLSTNPLDALGIGFRLIL